MPILNRAMFTKLGEILRLARLNFLSDQTIFLRDSVNALPSVINIQTSIMATTTASTTAPTLALSTSIRLLANGNNQRGDLFNTLAKDLFFALGYDQLRLNVHKSGRELDIVGQHRHESRKLVAECKAHQKPMGGDELNKFLGVLTRERKRDNNTPVAGYFVSLGGFTETARQQEADFRAGNANDATILFDAKGIIAELARSQQLIAQADAMEKAGACRQHAQLAQATAAGAQLLGTTLGYVWAIFYAHGKQRSHFALIHADGTPLAQAVADELLAADDDWRKEMAGLTYLAPPAYDQQRQQLTDAAAQRYRTWLAEECGYMQLDGLPADNDLGSSRPRLERLFVPLKAHLIATAREQGQPEWADDEEKQMLPIGHLLAKYPRLALLAAPGGGKSTLLKRLATAYAMPQRLSEAADDLPKQDWLPLLLRCRDLREQARQPILTLLQQLAQFAAMSAEEAPMFQSTVHDALRTGRALLLIDGLDELSDTGARQQFSQNLRTFAGMFPGIRILLTSREAGFRAVAGVIASVCQQAGIAALDEGDVRDLCQRWYREVYQEDAQKKREAEELASTIWENERIRKLAENPLLLTTLLVVKRGTRELPRKRADLYRAAINVLVKTWNTEGHEPMDEEETLVQLSWIACAMMQDGIQRIDYTSLLKLLERARKELQQELRYSTIAPAKFIERIELRSSLLMQTGHMETDSGLQPVYEFRHLTFQEYLTARGLVEGHYPGRDEEQPLEELLQPHFNEEAWREVLPLAAVLAKRKAEKLIGCLAQACDVLEREPGIMPNVVRVLAQCVADQVQVGDNSLQQAYWQLGRFVYEGDFWPDWLRGILADDRAGLFQRTLEQGIWQGDARWQEYLSAMVQIAWQTWDHDPARPLASLTQLCAELAHGNPNHRLRAALVCMRLVFSTDGAQAETDQTLFASVMPGLIAMLDSPAVPEQIAASLACAWLGRRRLLQHALPAEYILRCFGLWQQHEAMAHARYFAWALSAQALLPRATFAVDAWGDCAAFLTRQVDKGREHRDAAMVVIWYRHGPLNDVELVNALKKSGDEWEKTPTTRELLANLGEAGQAVLARWQKEKEARWKAAR